MPMDWVIVPYVTWAVRYVVVGFAAWAYTMVPPRAVVNTTSVTRTFRRVRFPRTSFFMTCSHRAGAAWAPPGPRLLPPPIGVRGRPGAPRPPHPRPPRGVEPRVECQWARI